MHVTAKQIIYSSEKTKSYALLGFFTPVSRSGGMAQQVARVKKGSNSLKFESYDYFEILCWISWSYTISCGLSRNLKS